MGTVKPYGSRVCVVDPPIEEQNRDSGLIVISTELLDVISVGIVVEGGDGGEEVEWLASYMPNIAISVGIKKGMLVYYRKGAGILIKDVRVIALADIVAYEELD